MTNPGEIGAQINQGVVNLEVAPIGYLDELWTRLTLDPESASREEGIDAVIVAVGGLRNNLEVARTTAADISDKGNTSAGLFLQAIGQTGQPVAMEAVQSATVVQTNGGQLRASAEQLIESTGRIESLSQKAKAAAEAARTAAAALKEEMENYRDFHQIGYDLLGETHQAQINSTQRARERYQDIVGEQLP